MLQLSSYFHQYRSEYLSLLLDNNDTSNNINSSNTKNGAIVPCHAVVVVLTLASYIVNKQKTNYILEIGVYALSNHCNLQEYVTAYCPVAFFHILLQFIWNATLAILEPYTGRLRRHGCTTHVGRGFIVRKGVLGRVSQKFALFNRSRTPAAVIGDVRLNLHRKSPDISSLSP
jgi:hypothetical protein